MTSGIVVSASVRLILCIRALLLLLVSRCVVSRYVDVRWMDGWQRSALHNRATANSESETIELTRMGGAVKTLLACVSYSLCMHDCDREKRALVRFVQCHCVLMTTRRHRAAHAANADL